MSQTEKKISARIKTDDTLMETALHGTSLFPFRFYDEKMEDFDFKRIDWHWHTEFEFVYIESGMVHFHIGEKSFPLSEGQGIFINSKLLHQIHASKMVSGLLSKISIRPGHLTFFSISLAPSI